MIRLHPLAAKARDGSLWLAMARMPLALTASAPRPAAMQPTLLANLVPSDSQRADLADLEVIPITRGTATGFTALSVTATEPEADVRSAAPWCYEMQPCAETRKCGTGCDSAPFAPARERAQTVASSPRPLRSWLTIGLTILLRIAYKQIWTHAKCRWTWREAWKSTGRRF